MSHPDGLALLGCGGHARSVADVALARGIAALRFVDPGAREGERIMGFEAVPSLAVLPDGWLWFPASGDNRVRQRDLGRVAPRAVHTLVAPGAHVSAHATLGRGVFVGHGCHVGPCSSLGDGALVNNGAIVEHDCVVGRFCHVSVHATLAGGVVLGERVMIGAGATVIDGMTIVDDVVVGAGATVVSDLLAPGTYVGTPARRLDR